MRYEIRFSDQVFGRTVRVAIFHPKEDKEVTGLNPLAWEELGEYSKAKGCMDIPYDLAEALFLALNDYFTARGVKPKNVIEIEATLKAQERHMKDLRYLAKLPAAEKINQW